MPPQSALNAAACDKTEKMENIENMKKSVSFGTKQEAIITPKDGYEIESVIVTNTATNNTIPVDVKQVPENPTQWVCSFVQPAAHVTIKPIVRPIIYSITFDVSDEYDIILVEQGSLADVEIQSSVSKDDTTSDETPSDFRDPQHSSDNSSALDVGENESDTEANSSSAVVDENEDSLTAESDEVKSESSDENQANVSEETEDAVPNNDVPYDAEDFEDELEGVEPVEMSRSDYDKKIELYWSWKTEFDMGKCPEYKFLDIKKRHLQFLEDVHNGKIVLVD